MFLNQLIKQTNLDQKIHQVLSKFNPWLQQRDCRFLKKRINVFNETSTEKRRLNSCSWRARSQIIVRIHWCASTSEDASLKWKNGPSLNKTSRSLQLGLQMEMLNKLIWPNNVTSYSASLNLNFVNMKPLKSLIKRPSNTAHQNKISQKWSLSVSKKLPTIAQLRRKAPQPAPRREQARALRTTLNQPIEVAEFSPFNK